MKRVIVILTLLILTISEVSGQKVNYKKSPMELENGDKLAILMVHFGTTNDQSRAKTQDSMTKLVENEFKDAKVVEAYSSRIIIKHLKRRGIVKLTPLEALEQLYKDGFTHIVVQSTHIIDGVEMESLRGDVEICKSKFKDLRIGTPLLYTPEDYERTIKIVTKEIETDSDAVLLVGHGTYDPITASYAMVDYMLKLKGFNNWSVATIEGYPTFDQALYMLSKSKAKSVCLVPFMFVAGVHAIDDIAGDWREMLEAKGYKVEVLMQGLGENEDVRKIYIEHIKFAMNNVHLNIMNKKTEYAK